MNSENQRFFTSLKRLIRSIFRFFDFEVITKTQFQHFTQAAFLASNFKSDIQFLIQLPKPVVDSLAESIFDSKSQLRQDLFVLWKLNFKENGFFVEFGAGNGVHLSNTWLLEKHFGWTGILAEPARHFHSQLKKSRSKSYLEKACVWRASGLHLKFLETRSPELSTLSEYQLQDSHFLKRSLPKSEYQVETISLIDLLMKYDAPQRIDYLSIDTEGSEFEILKEFDFRKYTFSIITVEHNYTAKRESIFQILSSHGYQRVLTEISKFDDWYVHNSLL